jgi:23S rRNA pseudouridine2604 synthase
MSTLKISKKPADPTVTRNSPVRRADPTKRDRSKPFVKAERPTEPVKSQRNHRHDGSFHEATPKTSDSRAPSDRPILRSEFKARAFVEDKNPLDQNEGKSVEFKRRENKNNNRIDDNATNRDGGKVQSDTTRNYADREGAYRNPPRRGGKARDGFVASEFDKTRAQREAIHKVAAAKLPKNDEANPRLSKRMAELGICSRREADEWIVNGWVKVDGVIIETLGTRINPDAEIIISGYAKEHQSESVTILLHKPVGYVSGQAEDGYEPAIVLVHPDNEWVDDPELNMHNQKEFIRGFLRNLAPAGRLDIDSTGLLVLTQDGRIARQLIGEDSSIEKEYLVRVEGELSENGLAKLNHGLSLDGVALKPAKVSWQNEEQLRFVLREGKKRQIRRMCELVGLHVVGLKRVRIGSVNLGKLPVGQWRYLRADERF